MPRTLLAALICALLTACSSEPTKTAAPAPATAKPAPAPTANATPVAMESEVAKRQRILKALAEKSVYFDYDDFSIKPEYGSLIQQDSAAIRSAPSLQLRLEGNADERGSTEYNLALGQKRAEAVRHALELMGVPASQMEAVSYGKEKPRASCHEEKCWSENRRVDFAAKTP